MKKSLFILLLAILSSTTLHAYDAEIDGIYYNFSGDKATVTRRSYNSSGYSGVVAIPSYVTYNDKAYLVTSIGESAFRNSNGLTSVTIPNSVTSIGLYAFRACSGLTSITIPNSVTSIVYNAFDGCFFVKTSLVNNSSLTSSDNWGATLCDIETSDGLLIANNILLKCRPWATAVTIPESVTSIGEYAFYECSVLTSVIIPNGITSIGNYAFQSCSSLTSVAIPNSVTSINDFAFFDCNELTSITIPESVTYIGSNAFYGTPWFNNQPDGLVYINKVAYHYKGTMPEGTEIVIREGCLAIAGMAFLSCNGLTGIVIPESVTKIGDDAFRGCKSLTSITIPNSVTSIGSYAFSGCSGLTSIAIPNGVTIINRCVFDGCTSLQSVTLPDSVKEIGQSAFSNCSSLTSFSIPKGVTSIGYGAFRDCKSLGTIIVPENVDSIGSGAFYDCTGLRSVTINGPVKIICSGTFYNCQNAIITLPNSVVELGTKSFESTDGCTVYLGSKIKEINEAFYYSYDLTIYIDALSRPHSGSFCFYPSGSWTNKAYVPYGCGYSYLNEPYHYGAGGTYYWLGSTYEMPYPSLNIGKSRVTTYCSEKPMDFSSLANVKAYVATGFSPSTQTLLLTRVMQVPAGEGVIVIGEPGTYEVPECETDMVFCNMLKGLILPQELSPTDDEGKSVFTLNTDEEETGFYPLTEKQKYAAGTAYLHMPEEVVSSDVKQIKIEIGEGISTEVECMPIDKETTAAIVYGIDGQRRASARKGINIIRRSDGTTRKVLVK